MPMPHVVVNQLRNLCPYAYSKFLRLFSCLLDACGTASFISSLKQIEVDA